MPVIRHYPATGDTTEEDSGVGFGNTGTLNIDPRGTLEIAFDRKFTVAATDTIPASTCEFTADFKGAFEACVRERQNVGYAQVDYDAAKDVFLQDARIVEAIENARYRFMFGPVSALLASATASQMERHDVAEARFERSGDKFKQASDELAKRKKELADCLKGKLSSTLGSRRSLQASAKRCTEKDWSRLVERARALKLQTLAPRARTIVTELKSGQQSQAARDLERLRADFRAERKRVNAFWKAVQACR